MKTALDSIPMGMSTIANPSLGPCRDHMLLGFKNFISRDLLGFIRRVIVRMCANEFLSENQFTVHILWALNFQLQ